VNIEDIENPISDCQVELKPIPEAKNYFHDKVDLALLSEANEFKQLL